VLSDLVVAYRDGGNGSATDNMINPHLRLVNNGTQAVAYSNLTIRYWFTSEENNTLNFWCDWAQLGTGFVNGTFGTANGMDYLEISLDAGAGSLDAGQNSGPLQTRFAKANWSPFNETDDYSYNATSTSFSPNDKITLYVNGSLVWGIEPTVGLAKASQVEKAKIMASPNPVIHELTLNAKTSLKNATVQIIDFSGRVFFTKEIKKDTKVTKLDFNPFQSGTYLIQIQQGNNVTVKQVIK